MGIKEHYLEYDFINDVIDKGFIKELSLEWRDLYYSILEDTDWDEGRSRTILEDCLYLDYEFLLNYLNVTGKELVEEGITNDEFVDVVYDRGIEQLEKEGFTIIKTCGYTEWFAYKIE